MNVTAVSEAIKATTDDVYTWPEVALILGIVWAMMWCIKNI
jgi:hypothetical protein